MCVIVETFSKQDEPFFSEAQSWCGLSCHNVSREGNLCQLGPGRTPAGKGKMLRRFYWSEKSNAIHHVDVGFFQFAVYFKSYKHETWRSREIRKVPEWNQIDFLTNWCLQTAEFSLYYFLSQMTPIFNVSLFSIRLYNLYIT